MSEPPAPYVDKWPHRVSLVFGPEVGLRETMRGTYEALTGTPMPEGAIEESREPRGFMIGVGQTYTYLLSIGDELWIRTEDWWEDNIADPDEYTFMIAARTNESMERAASALLATAATHQWTLKRRQPA